MWLLLDKFITKACVTLWCFEWYVPWKMTALEKNITNFNQFVSRGCWIIKIYDISFFINSIKVNYDLIQIRYLIIYLQWTFNNSTLMRLKVWYFEAPWLFVMINKIWYLGLYHFFTMFYVKIGMFDLFIY